ncbi:MAG: response regulator [Desulfobacterales bacterium]|nr:response regulator [Desulfobacterales bacterium]
MANPKRLLVVDDSEEILISFNEFLITKGYEVETAVDGFAALKILRDSSNHFDCLITDLVMPNISGVGLISIVKKEYPDLKIIAMTGYGNPPSELASEAAADIVLQKPIDLYTIEEQIVDLLNQTDIE